MIEALKELYNLGIPEETVDNLYDFAERDAYKCYQMHQHGKTRIIEEPKPELKQIQKHLLEVFKQFPLHSACKSRKGLGIGDNASPHKDAKYVLNMDIKSCYQNTSHCLVESGITEQILNQDLKNKMLRATRFCFVKSPGNSITRVLPTGAPTSPILCNIALTRLDHQLATLAEDWGYTYTRYVDDLCFSTTAKNRDWNLIDKVTLEVTGEGYTPNKKKTRWYTKGKQDRIVITGVQVGKQDRVPTQFKRMLRAKLQNLAKRNLPLDPEAHGCLAYVKSIDQNQYEKFLGYFQRRQEYGKATQ